MDNRRIGLFDSGLGGLTVMKELMRLLPEESIIYFGDTGRLPYGSKSVETVIKYTKSDINFLQSFDLKLIVAACGTASSIALPHLAGSFSVPVMGVIDATARHAARTTQNGCIGVIATEASIRSDAYRQALLAENADLRVVSVSCPLFVPLVENGYSEKEATRLIAEDYLKPIQESRADTLILGCTHYPLLRGVISRIMGDGVSLINPGVCVAQEARETLAAGDMLSSQAQRDAYRFYLSDDPSDFARLGSVFLERPIHGLVSQVNIEEYSI